MTESAKRLAETIAGALDSKKASDIMIIDIADMTIIADGFVVASGNNVNQTKALCDEVERVLEAQGINRSRLEGYSEGRWIVMDYSDILVHIFHREEREFYNLERLWDDGSNTTRWNDGITATGAGE